MTEMPMTTASGPRNASWCEGVSTTVTGVITSAQQVFGLLLAATLAWSLLAFPIYKQVLLGYVPVGLGAVIGLALALRGPRHRLTQVLQEMGEARYVLCAIGLAVLARLVALMLVGREPVSDFESYHATAVRMLNGRGFGPPSPFAPGMTFWLLGVYAVFGPSVLAAQLVNAGLGGLLTWLTYDIGRRVTPLAVARLAALSVAAFPSLVLYATTLGYDPLLSCAMLTAVALFLRGDARHHSLAWVALIGLVLGITTYVKPIGLLMPPIFALAYWMRGATLLRTVRNGVLIFLVLYASIYPWILRNSACLGERVGLTTTGGSGLWAANNPEATGLCMPVPETPELSVTERDRYFWREAWAFIGRHPDRFLQLALTKSAYQWGTSSTVLAFVSADRMNPSVEAGLKLLINVAWTALCALVVVALLRDRVCRGPVLFWPLLGLLAYFWGIHLFYEAQSRYHLPFLPILAILAASAWLSPAGVGGASQVAGTQADKTCGHAAPGGTS